MFSHVLSNILGIFVFPRSRTLCHDSLDALMTIYYGSIDERNCIRFAFDLDGMSGHSCDGRLERFQNTLIVISYLVFRDYVWNRIYMMIHLNVFDDSLVSATGNVLGVKTS